MEWKWMKTRKGTNYVTNAFVDSAWKHTKNPVLVQIVSFKNQYSCVNLLFSVEFGQVYWLVSSKVPGWFVLFLWELVTFCPKTTFEIMNMKTVITSQHVLSICDFKHLINKCVNSKDLVFLLMSFYNLFRFEVNLCRVLLSSCHLII